MKRLVMTVCVGGISLLWQTTSAQQQQANPMPPAAAGILGQMDREILVAKKKAVDSLEKVLRDTTKKGDLAGAMAVKETLDRLNGEIGAAAQNRGGRGNTDIIGRWQGQGWVLEFKPDGTVGSSDAGVTGTWTTNGTAVEVTFSNGITHTVEKTADGWSGVFKSGGKPGGAVRYTRTP